MRNRDGRLELDYIDRHGLLDVIENREALCDAAGCRCHGPATTCGHTDGHYYEPLFAQAYTEMCFHSCHCDLLPSVVGGGIVPTGVEEG